MLLVYGIENTDNPRSMIQNGMWPLKFLLFCGSITGMFFVQPSAFYNYWIVALVFNAIFIVLQCLMLFDFARSTSEAWVANYEESDGIAWQVVLVTSTLVSIAAFISVTAILYVYLSSGCPLNTFFITFNLILCVIQIALSIHPKILDANRKGGLLPACFLSVYNVYLVAIATSNNPAQCGVLSSLSAQTASDSQSSVNTALQISGIVFAVLAIAYSAFSGGSTDIIVPDTRNSNRDNETPDLDDEAEQVAYNYSFFHFIFCLASFYFASVFTNWNSITSASTSGDSLVAINKGYGAVWVPIVSSWVNVALYVWSLVAPLVFPDREF